MLNENSILKQFRKQDKLAIAFSGGSDSCCLSYIMKKKTDDIYLVSVFTPYHSLSHINFAKQKAAILGLPLEIIKIHKIDETIKNNSKLRCYYCKKLIFTEIKKKFPNRIIIDGTNYSDTKEYRPGLKALEELKILSPFKNTLTVKKDITDYLRRKGLENLISLPETCNATRIKYGIPIATELLKLIEKTEKYLFEQGVTFSRFRIIDKNCYIIESTPEFLKKINNNVLEELKKIASTDNINIMPYNSGVFD